MHSIYMYTNTVNGKVYIGQTKTSLEQRAQKDGKTIVNRQSFTMPL
jgi:predicted GIY-YIG superfamily endonuclease